MTDHDQNQRSTMRRLPTREQMLRRFLEDQAARERLQDETTQQRYTEDRGLATSTRSMQSGCRQRQFVVPPSKDDFLVEVYKWIRHCVASRTEVRGLPILRETELVGPNNSTINEVWNVIQGYQGQRVEVRAEYIWGAHQVEQINFSVDSSQLRRRTIREQRVRERGVRVEDLPRSVTEEPTVPVADDVAHALEVYGFVVHGGHFVAELAGAAALEMLFGGLVLGVGIIASILTLPALLTVRDKKAYYNARLIGFCVALEEMAKNFESPDLPRLPLSQWPRIPHPTQFRRPRPDEYILDRITLNGRRKGIRIAKEEVNRQKRKVPPHGDKVFLWLLKRAFPGNLEFKLRQEILRRQGYSDWRAGRIYNL